MAPNSKINLKDKVDDGEMDLSMCDMQDVPVKEIAAYKKVYSLDLSNNHLIQLPKNFSSLTNLTKLDLSKNKLKRLPDNFGDLVRLRHLDLYKNEIQHLPLSFGSLKNLKWLDLKDNPLVPAIKEAAGQCLDSKQCQVCATNMIYFFTKLKEKVEEEKEIREKQRQKDKQANEIAAQKIKQQQEKKIKKKEKVKQCDEPVTQSEKSDDIINTKSEDIVKPSQRSFKFLSYIVAIYFFIMLVLFILTSIKLEITATVEKTVLEYWHVALNWAPPYMQDVGSSVGETIKEIHQNMGKFILNLKHHEYFDFFINKFNEYSTSVYKYISD